MTRRLPRQFLQTLKSTRQGRNSRGKAIGRRGVQRVSNRALGARGVLLLLVLNWFPVGLRAQVTPSRLELADRIRMVEDVEGSGRPFFRVQFNVVSEQGLPVSIVPPKDLVSAFEVAENGGPVHRPLFLRYNQESLSQVPSDIPNQRYALLLIDISGSMLDSSGTGSDTSSNKYEAAKLAARKFLSGFQPGQDHVAIVAFESHGVRDRIKAAVFAGDFEGAENQIEQLPAPQKNYNTGLYSAVDTALDVLADVKRRNPTAGALLVALTDGQNQTLPGDDPDLLTGDQGLEAVVAKANTVGLQIMTIGFGDESIPTGRKGALDLEALRRLAWPNASQFHAAQDVKSLGSLFGVARELLVNRWQLTFATLRQDRGSLVGQDLQFQIRLRLNDRLLQSPWVSFKTPQMSAPPFEGKLDAAEREALSKMSSKTSPTQSVPLTGTPVTRRLLILTVFGASLAFLWFVLPLILWPKQVTNQAMEHGSVASQPENRLVPEERSSAAAASTLAQPVIRDEPNQTQIQFGSLGSAPDRTLFDPRGQETLLIEPDPSSRSAPPSETQVQISPFPDVSRQPRAAAPDTTLILDRFPGQNQPGQTQIQFAPLRQRNSPEGTLLDPRGEQTVVLKPDETIIDPRGEETIILSPQEKPPSKA